MTTNLTLLIAAILLLTGGFQQAKPKSAQSDWIVFAPKDGGYSVKLPDKPIELPFTARYGRGTNRLHFVRVNA